MISSTLYTTFYLLLANQLSRKLKHYRETSPHTSHLTPHSLSISSHLTPYNNKAGAGGHSWWKPFVCCLCGDVEDNGWNAGLAAVLVTQGPILTLHRCEANWAWQLMGQTLSIFVSFLNSPPPPLVRGGQACIRTRIHAATFWGFQLSSSQMFSFRI